MLKTQLQALIAAILILLLITWLVFESEERSPMPTKEYPQINIGFKPPLHSDEIITCLTDNLYYEARHDEAEIAEWYNIIHVVMKRVRLNNYPTFVCDVIYQDKQFSWSAEPYTVKEYDRYALAEYFVKDFLESFDPCDEHNPQFDHYYAHNKVTPRWAKKAKESKVVGQHTFIQLYDNEVC
jgi:spore germination cell wall hydrolase CwlJ-like protein